MPSLGHRRGFLLSVQHLQARQSAEGVAEPRLPHQQVFYFPREFDYCCYLQSPHAHAVIVGCSPSWNAEIQLHK